MSYEEMTDGQQREELARLEKQHADKLAEIASIEREIARLEGGAK